MVIQYLSVDEIIEMNRRLLTATGGLFSVRDRHRIEYLVEVVQDDRLFRGIWNKAALYLCRIAQSQAFIDGNKRTAFQAADTFLYMNGFELHPPSTARTVQYILAIARKERTRENARHWLRRHSSQAGWTALVP